MRKIIFIFLALVLSFSSTFLFSISVHPSSNHLFSDIRSDEVVRLHDEEIINGYPDGTFRPNRLVTRAEAATMIGRSLLLDGSKRPTIFPDMSETHFASGFVQSAEHRHWHLGGVFLELPRAETWQIRPRLGAGPAIWSAQLALDARPRDLAGAVLFLRTVHRARKSAVAAHARTASGGPRSPDAHQW